MKLPGLVVLVVVVILRCSNAGADAAHRDPDCEDCDGNGSWFPLFKPSQIISSEFPEHEQYRSQEAPAPLTYATARPQISQESQSHECEDTHPQVVDFESREATGIDSPVKSYNVGNGEHRVEWDHYGDITTVATVAYNSLEDRSGPQRGGAPVGAGVSGEDRSDALGNIREQGDGRDDLPEQDTSASLKSQEESFFENGSFFDEKRTAPKDSFPEDFEVSNEYMYSGEHPHHSNSIEGFNSYEDFGKAKKPVATSYASISSVFESRPIPRSRDLLHPDLSYNDISHYIDINPRLRVNKTKQYLVHEPQSHEAPALHNTHVGPGSFPLTISRNSKPILETSSLGHRPSSYVPLDHPVYRYVKVHGGSVHHRLPQSRSTLRWEDIHPQLRSKFPFKYLRPRVHIQNHETFVNHVVPTKDPFPDSFWRESQKIEDLKPPPLGQTLYYFKKKSSPIEMKSLARRRQRPSYMYIMRRNKKVK